MSIRVVPSATHGEDLGLAAGEQRRAVRARRDVDLGLDRADLVRGAAVGALLVDGDALADDVLLELGEGGLDLGRPLAVGLLVVAGRARTARRPSSSTASIASWRSSLASIWVASSSSSPWEPWIESSSSSSTLGSSISSFSLPALPRSSSKRGDQLLDLGVRDVERVEDLLLGDAVGAGLDHQDRLVGAGDDQVELELLVALLLGVDDEVAVELADPDRADVLGDGDLGDRQRGGGAVHREDVVGVDVVDRHRRGRPAGSRGASPWGRAGGSAGRSCARSASPSRPPSPRGGRTSRGSCPRRSGAPRRPPSAAGSRRRGSLPAVAVQRTIVSPARTTTDPLACLASFPVSKEISLPPTSTETRAYFEHAHVMFSFTAARMAAFSFQNFRSLTRAMLAVRSNRRTVAASCGLSSTGVPPGGRGRHDA